MQSIEKKFKTLDHYNIIRQLGSGLTSKVKLAIDQNTNQQYAIKILKDANGKLQQNIKTTKNEVSVMKELQHKHIVNLVQDITIGNYKKPNEGEKRVVYIVLEYAIGHELFEYVEFSKSIGKKLIKFRCLFKVANTGRFEEKMARTFFHQILSALEYIHSQGIAHRDIKPENILLDSQFFLKIADFGFSTLIAGKDGSGKLKSQLGTDAYMAPEINLQLPYSGVAVDLFATAIILFIMVSGNPPFAKADPQDSYFKQLCTNKHEIFWKAHLQHKQNASFYSEEFKELMNSMLAFDPTQRLSLSEIKAHKWFQGEVVTQEQIIYELKERKKIIEIKLEKQRMEKLLKKQEQQQQQQSNMLNGEIKGFRSIEQEVHFQQLFQFFQKEGKQRENNTLILRKAENMTERINNHYNVIDPKFLFDKLQEYCKTNCNSFQLSDKFYKLRCKMIQQEETIQFDMELFKIDEETNCISFIKKSGPLMLFYEETQKIKSYIDKF